VKRLQRSGFGFRSKAGKISRGMPEQPTKSDRPEKHEGQSTPSTADKAAGSQKVTPEEQMALYEKELEEDDWGHQPC
jgi:hypothetical protein